MTQPRCSHCGGRWLWLSLIVIILDQLSKQVADHLLGYAQPVEVLPFFNLTLLYNTGAAFSFLAAAGGWQRWLFALIALGVCVFLVVWLRRTDAKQVWLRAAIALVLGGALGNLFDRIVLGHVIDFISVHGFGWYFPAFNIADSAITIGAVLLVVDMVFGNNSKHPVQEGEHE